MIPADGKESGYPCLLHGYESGAITKFLSVTIYSIPLPQISRGNLPDGNRYQKHQYAYVTRTDHEKEINQVGGFPGQCPTVSSIQGFKALSHGVELESEKSKRVRIMPVR